MASEKYKEVMTTDFEGEATKSLNNIYDLYNETMDLMNKNVFSPFELHRQLGLIRWAEREMAENLQDFKDLVEARAKRRAEKQKQKVSA